MGEGELSAAFRSLARQAAETAAKITGSAARLTERTAEIEEGNLAALAQTDADAAKAITAAGTRTPTTKIIPSSGRTFVTTPWGVTYDIPAGWNARIADNGQGIVYQKPGSPGNKDMIRIMDPTPRYPNGYARVFNQYGQPMDVNGRPASRPETHIPAEYVGPWPAWP